jgi:Raf kinase inhibitor-like YbhB/YbcL family protein
MWNLLALAMISSGTLTVQSPAFANKNYIPPRFTCEGLNINPGLMIGDIPGNTQSLALIIDDPDSPNGVFDHWIIWNIPVTKTIKENSAPGIQGKNGRSENKYTGPCPPNGIHEYHFRVYALDDKIDLPKNSDKNTLLKAMEGHIISSGELIGLYKKQS